MGGEIPWVADFGDAHARHWEDASRLWEAERLANADHLYGLSAECGLKAIMVCDGIPLDREDLLSDKDKKKYWVHIDNLWGIFHSFAEGRVASTYAAMLPARNPFEKWRVRQRYAHRTHITRELAEEHRNGASRVRSVVKRAQKDGMLS